MRARVLLLLALAWVPALAAQGHPTPAPDGALFEGIVLTVEQRGRVDSIWSAHGPIGMMAMHAAAHGGEGCRAASQGCTATGENHAAVHRQLQAAYREVLTPEQQPVFDRNAERLGAAGGPCPAMGAGRPGGPGGGHPRHGR